MSMRGGAGKAIGLMSKEKAKLTRPLGVLVKALGGFMKGIGKLLLGAAFFSLIYAATQLINPLILTKGIEAFPENNSTGIVELFGIEMTVVNGIITLVAVFGVLGVLGFLLNSFSIKILAKANSIMVNSIRVQLYSKLINSSMDYIKNEQSGNITARITSDTDQIATGIHVFTIISIQLVLLVATFVLVLVKSGWQIILISLASVPIALLISAVLSRVGRKIVLRIRKAFGIASGKMAESFSGVAVSKSFNREEELSGQMSVLNQQYYKMSQKFGLMMNITMPLIAAISTLTVATILWVGGKVTLGPAEIFLGITLSRQFLRPITLISLSFPELQNSLGAVDRIVDVMEAAPAIEDSPTATPLKDNYAVEFENVWFAYEKEKFVIKDVSISVEEGEMVALVGHTGAGKTTIASMLLTRFYDVNEGSIKIGNQDIRDLTQASLRGAIGLIPQEPYLFTATVLENIKYGKPDATDEEIFNISKLIGADAFIAALPDGYETMVREGGKHLSAGQRQMITIARTMLADPKILILDEATSRLDAYSESLVQSAQRKLFENRTTFVIAHRLSTIHDAEKIFVLEMGKLIESGDHNKLMKQDGIYADLYNTYYSFQGLDAIDDSHLDDEEEKAELSLKALMAMGPEGQAKIKEMINSGKITKEELQKKMGKKMGGPGMSGKKPHG